jgi:hypothetical protein
VKEYVEFDRTLFLDADKKFDGGKVQDVLYFSAGKKEKLSRGDIVGFLVKEGGADAGQIGKIEVFDHYSLAAVPSESAKSILNNVKGKKIKGEKRLVSLLD